MTATDSTDSVSLAPYMHWSKVHEQAECELSGSNLLHCTLEDLPGWEERMALIGPNDDGYAPLTEAIADHYGVSPGRVFTAAGASGANFLTLAALAGPGQGVLVERPGYDPHPGAARLLGAPVGRFERRFEDGWRIDPGRIESALREDTRLVVLTNPHNPGGILATDEELRGLAELAERRGLHVLIDEVYLDSAPGDTASAVGISDRFVVTSSLTKSYGLSGLRVGWGVATPALAEEMRRVRDVVDAVGSFPAESLAVLAFERLSHLTERARRILEPNRALVHEFMERRPELLCVPPTGGAVAFPRRSGLDDASEALVRLRSEYGLGLVPGSFFGTPAHFRIAMGGENAILRDGLERLDRALEDGVFG